MKAAEQLIKAKQQTASLRLKPPLLDPQLSERLLQLPGSLPAEIRELVAFASGFVYEPFGEVAFLPTQIFGFTEIVPFGLQLASDECGNSWVVDIDAGTWGPILFFSHDPPVMVIQAPNLSSFIEQIFEARPTSLLSATDAAIDRIWASDPFLIEVEHARQSLDPDLRGFADRTPTYYRLADLRQVVVGSGFCWGRKGPESKVTRFKSELLFSVEQ